jgi:ribosomal protein L40E
MICPNCGTQNPDDAEFCIECGTKLAEADAYCINCGAKLKPDAVFCPKCGVPVGSVLQPSAAPSASVGGVPAAGSQTEAASNKKVAAIVVVVVVAALVGVFALHWFGVIGDVGPLAMLPKQSQESSGQVSSQGASGTQDSSGQLEDLVGMSQSDAEEAISDAGLTVGDVTSEESDTVEEGCVISYDLSGSSVDLVVSSGAAEHVFTLVTGQYTVEEAEKYCEEHDGYLATFADEEEYQRGLDAVEGSDLHFVWIGGYRDSSGEFVRRDGSSLSYTAWASGEPNDDEGNEDYLALIETDAGWAWYDVPGDVSSYYKPHICGFLMETEE